MVSPLTDDGGRAPPLALPSRREALALLRREFPLTFPSPPAMLRPLALGIRGEIFARLTVRFSTNGRDRYLLGQALGYWCSSAAYLSMLAAGGHRADLDGNDVEAVSDEHMADAQARLAERQRGAPKHTPASKPPDPTPQRKTLNGRPVLRLSARKHPLPGDQR